MNGVPTEGSDRVSEGRKRAEPARLGAEHGGLSVRNGEGGPHFFAGGESVVLLHRPVIHILLPPTRDPRLYRL